MNHDVLNLIKKLDKLCILSYYSINYHLRIKITELNYFANEYYNPKDTVNSSVNFLHEIKTRIFELLGIIPHCDVSNELIFTFNDLIIEFIDEMERQEEDISDLISAFDNMSVSFNLERGLSKIKI